MQKGFQVTFFLIFSIYFFSCTEERNPCLLSQDVLKDIQTLDSLIKVPEIMRREHELMKQNYNEPSLLNAENETYRFIWSSSFDGTEIDKIEEINGHYKFTKKVFSSHQDSIGVTSEFEIQKNDWNNIVNSLAGYNFWTYPYKIDRQGLDGANWTLEGYKPIKDNCTKKNYHRIGQWSPIDTTFIYMCNLLRKLKEK